MVVKFLRLADHGSDGAKEVFSRAADIFAGAKPKRLCTPLTFGMRDPGLWAGAMKLIGGGISPNGKIWISDEPMKRLEAIPLCMVNAGNEASAPVQVLADLVSICAAKGKADPSEISIALKGEAEGLGLGVAAAWAEAAECLGVKIVPEGTAADAVIAVSDAAAEGFAGPAYGTFGEKGFDTAARLAVMAAMLEFVKAALG